MSSHEAGGWPLKRLLTDVVGSGPRTAADMTRAQAREAFERVLAGEPDPTTLGAFLLAIRWKENTPEELSAFLDVMRERSVESAAPEADPVDCGANYDGKTDSALLGVAAGVVAAAAGTPVVAHSADRLPASEGDTYRHVLDELGVATDLPPADSARMVDETGFGFYDARRFNPGVDALLDRRRAMGVRTPINTVETLANPADADVHLGSFYHLSYARRITDTLRASEAVSVDRVVMVQGMEGYDDVRPGSTTVTDDRGDGLADFTVETGEHGLDVEPDDLDVADVAVDSARITVAVLAGEREDRFADAVALNAALRLYAGGAVEDLEEGVELARETIDAGEAAAVLSALREFEPTGQSHREPA